MHPGGLPRGSASRGGGMHSGETGSASRGGGLRRPLRTRKVGSMHPTGMLSCCKRNFLSKILP